jgi:hypothetical protein
MASASVVNVWGTSYTVPVSRPTYSLPIPNNYTNTTLPPTPKPIKCTDNNLDTECVTPPGVPYPFVLLQYSGVVTFNNVTVTLGYCFSLICSLI